jgi:hypothetical protein
VELTAAQVRIEKDVADIMAKNERFAKMPYYVF